MSKKSKARHNKKKKDRAVKKANYQDQLRLAAGTVAVSYPAMLQELKTPEAVRDFVHAMIDFCDGKDASGGPPVDPRTRVPDQAPVLRR